MSFDEDEKNFKGRDPGERDSYNMDNGGKKPSNSGDDFFKDEDFELEGYKDEEVESEGFRSKRIKEKRKKGKKFFRIIAAILVLVVVATGVVFLVVPWIKGKLPSKVEITEEEPIIIPESLALGEDLNIVFACASENLLEPDVNSIIFSSYYSSEEALISLCIPVNTLMDIPGIGAELVGESVKVGGMDLLSLTLEKNLGMDMKIDYYILLDVYNVVNKLGGIDLELDEEITVKNYDDGSTFKLEKGKNPVDGTKAVNFLKYFSGNDKEVPIENVTKQKLLFDAIISKIAGESDEKLSENLNLIKDFMDTDLSMEDRLKIFSTFSSIESDKKLSYALVVSSPTELEGMGIVYIPDVSGLAEIFKKEGTAPEEVAAVEETVNLTILNGVGAPGLAAEVSELLKSQVFESGKSKYNILKAENADNSNYDTTEILVYSGQSYVVEAANDIKSILEIGNIIAREDEGANSDIIIVLGADYKAKAEEEVAEEEVAQIIKINILNGEGTAELAFTAKGIIESYFNEDGKILEVVETKDADNWNYTQTKIIIFTSGEGVNTLAQQLQERLGVGVIEYSDNNVDNVDISIILGSDYTNK
ncbi:MAG: LCP family protein [Chloroflexi bacterium]|nr:LCP family protein [Chloroflexota bacterium]MBE3114316.1 LCP family protein [Actinomycetota bacterium]